MSFLRKCLPLIIAAGFPLSAIDKDKAGFKPGPASSFRAKQTNAAVTIAVQAYDTESLAKSAFGKLNPNEHGVLPILVVIQNDGQEAIRLDNLQVEYLTTGRSRVEATPAKDVPYLYGPRRPNMNPSTIPGWPRVKKNPLSAQEIEARAFVARMLPPGDSAHGFFYFQSAHRSGSRLYLSGLTEAKTGKELFYFEIPLDAQ